MKNRFAKIMLALVMLLVMAVPAQAFAAEKSYNFNTLNFGNFSLADFNKYLTSFDDNAFAAPTATPAQTQPSYTVPKTTAAPAQPADKATAAAPAKETQTAQAAPASSAYGSYEQQVVDLVNKERAAVGLPALKVNTKLAAVAEKKAEDLRDKNYFDHQSPTYGSPFDMMKQFGISYTSAGENIAKGQKTPADVMNGWMNSPGHKANILNSSYTEIGVGYVTDSNGTTYWVQHFIRP